MDKVELCPDKIKLMAKKVKLTSTPEDRAAFGERLKDILRALNLEQKALAESGCVGASTVSAYLSGQSQPAVDILSNWVRDFKFNANWLLTGEGEMFADWPRTTGIALPEEELSEKLTPEQRNMLTYKRLQTELGTSKERIADGLDAIITGKCVSESKKKYGAAEERGLQVDATDKVQEESAEFGKGI